MNEFQVPTEPVAVEIWCIDGRTFAGHVFVPTQSLTHDGPMRVEEWANGPTVFFPFTPVGSEDRTVLNKHEVVAMSLNGDPPEAGPCTDAPAYHVIVEARGRRFEGTLVAEMPRSQQRVVDVLNGPEAFLPLRHGHRLHLIQKARVVRVLEVWED